jgi:hypothetical protein
MIEAFGKNVLLLVCQNTWQYRTENLLIPETLQCGTTTQE